MSGNRPMTDFPRSEAGLVDNFIGTAYDVVKGVYDALPEIRELYEIKEEIPQLGVEAVEAAMVPARVEIAGLVQVAEDWANAAEASAEAAEAAANDAKKANVMYPFTFNIAQAEYDVTVIAGRSDVTTSGLALWVEGAIEYDFTITSPTKFIINSMLDYPDGAQMGIILNARFDNIIKNFDDLADAFTVAFDSAQAVRALEFSQFLQGSALEIPVPYVSGMTLTRPTQTVNYLGDDYRVNPIYLPLTTSLWETDAAKMVLIGNDSLREDLSSTTNPSLGSSLSGFVRTALADQITNTQQALSGMRLNIFEFAKYIPSRSGAPSTWDWTLATAAAQAYLSTRSKGIIFYPAGQYPHQYITRIAGVSLEGEGARATAITALPVTRSGAYGLVEIGPGAVSGSHIRGMSFYGSATTAHNAAPVNSDQWGCYFKAQWDAGYQHGGLWFSIHDDVQVFNFNLGVWSRGGYTINNYQRPNQFLQFRNVFIQVPNGGRALYLTGQHGQVEFLGGSAEGSDGMVASACIEIGMDPSPATMADNAAPGMGENTADVAGTGTSVQSPYNVNFSNSFSIQKSRKGIVAKNCRQISLRGVWVEDIAELIDLSTNAHLTVEASHLANPANGAVGGAAGSGYLFKLATNAVLEFKSTSDVIGTVDNYLEPTTNLNEIRSLKVEGLGFGDTSQKYKAAGYKTMVLTGAAIDVGAHKFVVINPSTTDYSLKLATLNATAAPGERITIRPLNGAITLTNLGNISLLGESEICCPQSGTLVLERVFQVIGSVEWVLISVSEHRATASPTDGFYYPQNHRIWRRGAVANQQMGWMVTTAGLAGSTLVTKAMPNLAA